MNIRGDLAAYALVALDLLCITVLAALGHPIPDILTLVAAVAAGGGAGASIPRSTVVPAAPAVPTV